MREILFRGKTFCNKWVYGHLVDNLIIYNANAEKNKFLHKEVQIKTIGQYTGLTDKNGTKIFEGDIVKLIDTHYQIEWYAKVEFGNPYCKYSWGYEFVYIKGDKVNTDCLLRIDMKKVSAYCEVIGNIYDNPELLGD